MDGISHQSVPPELEKNNDILFVVIMFIVIFAVLIFVFISGIWYANSVNEPIITPLPEVRTVKEPTVTKEPSPTEEPTPEPTLVPTLRPRPTITDIPEYNWFEQ